VIDTRKTHIGNFVEIKNTTVGENSKINHLSYVGDAIVGRRVNIGAGTITCNYDGVNKHQTIIEDDVFVGSDTQLVAPITVGAGATIGAGSTINKDAPPGELTLSRVPQQTRNALAEEIVRKAVVCIAINLKRKCPVGCRRFTQVLLKVSPGKGCNHLL